MLYSGIIEFKKIEDKVKVSVKASVSSVRISSVSHCEPFLEKKQKALHVWLNFGDGGRHGTIQGGV
jgi:hypothetical protein